MSVYRRMLMMAKLIEKTGTNLVLSFQDGVVTINYEGKGNKIQINGGEVVLGV